MDPRSLVCFCPGCAATYEVVGLAVGDIRCNTCEDHGQQLILEVRRYQDVKTVQTMKGERCDLDDKLCQEGHCTECTKNDPVRRAPPKAEQLVTMVVPEPVKEIPVTTVAVTYPEGLSNAEQKIWYALKAKPGQSAQELRVSLGYSTTIGTTAVIRDLIKKGLVEKKPDHLHDARTQLYSLKGASS
jgi:hypothetical protein